MLTMARVACELCHEVFRGRGEWADHQRLDHPGALGLVAGETMRPLVARPRRRPHTRRSRMRRRDQARTDHLLRARGWVGPVGPVGRPPPPEPRVGPRVAEGRPWEERNSDGSLNLGSNAVAAAEGMVLFAHDLFRERALALDADEFASPPSPGQVRALARRLLEAADRVQAAAREDGRYDRMDNSHRRARAAVRAAVELNPVPWGYPDGYDRWVADVVDYAGMLLTTTLSLVEVCRAP